MMKFTDIWPNKGSIVPRQKNLGYWEFLVYLVMTLGYRIFWDFIYTGRGYGDEVYILYQASNFLNVFMTFAYLYFSAVLILFLETKDKGCKSVSVVLHRVCAAAMVLSAFAAPVVFIASAVFAPSMAVPDAFALVAVIVAPLIALKHGILRWRSTFTVESAGEPV